MAAWQHGSMLCYAMPCCAMLCCAVEAAPACLDDDRGAILFVAASYRTLSRVSQPCIVLRPSLQVTSFAGASREAANACRDATRLLEALRLPFGARDVLLHTPHMLSSAMVYPCHAMLCHAIGARRLPAQAFRAAVPPPRARY